MYKILIVEEDERCRQALASTPWGALGFQDAQYAGSFAEGLDLALLHQPHVVLVGLSLGERMGYELIHQLRSGGQECICCLMAAHMDIHNLRRAMRAGCRDVLKRPPDPQALREFLEWAAVTQLHTALPEQALDVDPVLGKPCSDYGKVTNRILAAVRSDYPVSLSLTVIARRGNMSSKYIGRVFLKETGMRFSEYLMAYRMLEARRLILGTGEKISVIAKMVGYPQQNNFYTHFRQYFGVSPSSLRNVPAAEEAD